MNDNHDILLCFKINNTCFSSITGKFNSSFESIQILSKTEPRYEGFKINIYLRTVFIYLMYFVRPQIKTIYSFATNPISTYIMNKNFNVINDDLQEFMSTHNLTRETFTFENAKQFHAYFKEKYKYTRENAKEELDNMLENERMDYFGWKTDEEVLDFIMENMNDRAIILEINLSNSSSDSLQEKILNIPIQCKELNKKVLSTGGKNNKNRKKTRHSKKRHSKTKRRN